MSYKSRRPVKCVAHAEILAGGEGIDEGKMLADTYSEVLGLKVTLYIFIDSISSRHYLLNRYQKTYKLEEMLVAYATSVCN